MNACEFAKGADLVVVGLDERVRHRAGQRDAEQPPRFDGRGGIETCEIASARRQQARLGAMRAPQAEVCEPARSGGEPAARGLGRDHGLEVEQVDQPALDELRLGQRGDHPQDRFAREEHAALRHGVHVAREAQRRQALQGLRTETAGRCEPPQLVPGKAHGLEIVERPGRGPRQPGSRGRRAACARRTRTPLRAPCRARGRRSPSSAGRDP